MKILKALVVDDETPARNWLRRLLSDQPQVEIAAEADGVESARDYLRNNSVDVVFLDVQMPPFTGFDLLPDIPTGCQVIFITAYDTFAVRAFESNALDYLLKPVHPERLANTIGRLLSRNSLTTELPHIVSENLAVDKSALRLQDLLPLKDRQVLRMVSVSAISAIQAQGAYTRIYISGVPALMILCAIGDWEARLPSPPFARLDRSLIVNLTNIQEAITIDRNQTQLMMRDLESTFELGRAASQRLRFLLGQSTQPSTQETN
jgi:two-component system LytT family response regulator